MARVRCKAVGPPALGTPPPGTPAQRLNGQQEQHGDGASGGDTRASARPGPPAQGLAGLALGTSPQLAGRSREGPAWRSTDGACMGALSWGPAPTRRTLSPEASCAALECKPCWPWPARGSGHTSAIKWDRLLP